MRTTLKLCALVVLLASITCQTPTPATSCANVPFLSQIGARSVNTEPAVVVNPNICKNLVTSTATCCNKDTLKRLEHYFDEDLVLNSKDFLSTRRIDINKYLLSYQKIYDDIFFNYRDNLQDRAEKVMK